MFRRLLSLLVDNKRTGILRLTSKVVKTCIDRRIHLLNQLLVFYNVNVLFHKCNLGRRLLYHRKPLLPSSGLRCLFP